MDSRRLLVMAFSGLLLVFSEPLRFTRTSFSYQLALLAFAGFNAFIFHQPSAGRRSVGSQPHYAVSARSLPVACRSDCGRR